MSLGACPLCGAMLRQARNLRRHLITSCKFRLTNYSHNLTTKTQPQVDRVQEGQLQQMQTLPDNERLQPNLNEDKTDAVAPISCTELSPNSSSLMAMSSNVVE